MRRRVPVGLAAAAAALALAALASAALPPSLAGAEWSRLPTDRKAVALTVDACGNAAGVNSILTTLRERKATATFFLCGRWVRAFPRRARAIAARYPVGNHSDTHPYLTRLSDGAVRADVRSAGHTIRSVARRDPRPLFRFPFGDRDARTIRIVNSLGYGAIGWSVDTLGWRGRSAGSASSVVRRALAALRPGAIVLMHAGAAADGSTLDADALPRLIRAVRARGYELVTVRGYVRPAAGQAGGRSGSRFTRTP